MRAAILSLIGWVMIAVWGRTIRIAYQNRGIPEHLDAEGKNYIYAFWHGRQFLLMYGHRHRGIILPSSESRDGEIQARILKRFGYGVVRGSSKRKGDRALLGLVDGLRKGRIIALAVDGPRGPVYEAKQGVVYLSGKLNKPIVPVATGALRAWVLSKIWDHYLLPVPFTRGLVLYGEPIIVNGIDPAELESKRKELEMSLNALMARADAYYTENS